MAEKFDALAEEHVEFIGRQHLFFVGTAGSEGYVNVSPKGMDSFRVASPSQVVWLNLTGSGNETAAHVLENGRMTIMFCSFDKQPLIMRLYGSADIVHPGEDSWPQLAGLFPDYLGARQIFQLDLDMVQTSCGYAVPYYELKGERPTLTKWTENRGAAGIKQYWQDKNSRSLDNKPTGILPDAE